MISAYNDVLFFFYYNLYYRCSCFIYVIRVYLRKLVANTISILHDVVSTTATYGTGNAFLHIKSTRVHISD